LFRWPQLAVLLRPLFLTRRNSYSDNLSAPPFHNPGPARRVTMNTRSISTLITAATAVTALAAGLLLAISAPAPEADDFGQAVLAAAPADEA
jgi:hypothetical protein